MVTLDESLAQKRDGLLDLLAQWNSVAVAFSAGVDSTVVAKAAQLALGDRAVAVTAASDSLAEGEREEAERLATQIGIRHVVVETSEFDRPEYRRNNSDRCYHCKTELYERMEALLPRLGVEVIVNGANLDDRGDHRPGMTAAAEHRVRSPLIEAGFTKDDVRALAKAWDLPVWDKPAAPCLSSRIAYGLEVTTERTHRVDQAERFLRETLGLRELRVRHEQGELARIEVPVAALGALTQDDVRERIAARLHELGFKFVTLDLDGFRSGSLNAVLPVENLRILNRSRTEG